MPVKRVLPLDFVRLSQEVRSRRPRGVASAIRIAAIYSETVLALAVLASALVAACPQNLAAGIETPATARQLVTVEAKVARTTYAQLRTWRKVDGCWLAAGPYTARLGKNGLGEPARGRRDDADRHLCDRPHHVRQRGEPRRALPLPPPPLWRLVGRDPSSPTYNSFQHVACGTEPPFAGNSEGMWQQPRPYLPRRRRVQHAPRRSRQGLRDLPARADRRADDRLHLASQAQLRAVLRWLRPPTRR